MIAKSHVFVNCFSYSMVAVIGYFPQDVKNQFAHSFIYADDLRISFYRQYIRE